MRSKKTVHRSQLWQFDLLRGGDEEGAHTCSGPLIEKKIVATQQ